MRHNYVRKGALAAAGLMTAVGLSFASAAPASADGILYPRNPSGGCTSGIAVVYDGEPYCYVVVDDGVVGVVKRVPITN